MVEADDPVDKKTKQEARFLAQFETSGHKVVRITVGTLLLLLAVFLVGECFKLPYKFGSTTVTQAAPPVNPNESSQYVGTAKITSCEHAGWLHTYLFGDSWDCSGVVTWNNSFHTTNRFTTPNWSSDGDDTGKTFSAVKTSSKRGAGRGHDYVRKNDKVVEQDTGWFMPTMVICAIVTLIALGLGLGRVIPYRSRLEIYDNERKKLRERLLREGRIRPTDIPA